MTSAAEHEQRLQHGPVLPVLAKLALPNILAMVAVAATSIAETTYVGLLGRDPLAAMALIFPLVMLMQTFGLGLTLYFASQGAGKVLGPVLAGTLRLALVCVGGWVLTLIGAPEWAYFALVGVAMAAHGLATAAAVWATRWGPDDVVAAGTDAPMSS